jgi:hypothetical protein
MRAFCPFAVRRVGREVSAWIIQKYDQAKQDNRNIKARQTQNQANVPVGAMTAASSL